jgi:hypothetical protein
MKPASVTALWFLVVAFLAAGRMSYGQERGVSEDPDGFVNLRAGKSTSSEVVGKVKEREVFSIDLREPGEWAKVTLRSGQTGWMHRSRLRLHYTEDDLAKKSDVPSGDTELTLFGRSKGVDYYVVTRRALRGNSDALKQFFRFAEDVDGGAAEGYYSDLAVVIHLLGDEKFSQFLGGQSRGFRKRAGEAIGTASELAGMADDAYFKLRFPKSAKLVE